MPLTPKYTWEETAAEVQLRVALPGLHKPDLDVFLTEWYVKVNLPPYLLNLDLHGEVDEVKSTALIGADSVVFGLVKRVNGFWGKLAAEGDKREIAARRQKSVEDHRERAIEAHKRKVEMKGKAENKAFDKQWAKERAQRQLIQDRKDEELQNERDDIDAWKENLEANKPRKPRKEKGAVTRKGGVTIMDEEDEDVFDSDSDADSEDEASSVPSHHSKPAKPVPPAAGEAALPAIVEDKLPADNKFSNVSLDDKDYDEASSEDEAPPPPKKAPPKKVMVEVPKRAVPPPRETTVVQVDFEKLETDHLPAREGREKEIRHFKRKNGMNPTNPHHDTTDITEREPIFLKDKGDGFYRTGNLSAAINAYTAALQMDKTFIRCFANRAACHLQLGDAQACVDDCSEALRLQKDQDEDAAAREGGTVPRTRLLARRGRAYAMLNRLGEALEDYQTALRLDKENKALERDIQELVSCMKPLDVSGIRERGDARFKEKDYDGAKEAYTLLLQMQGNEHEMHAERVAAYSNRSACHLCTSDFGLAVDDADRGIALVTQKASGDHASVHELVAMIKGDAESCRLGEDEAQEATRKLSLARLLARRGTALGHLKNYLNASKDYEAAATLQRSAGNDGVAQQLESDLTIMQDLHSKEMQTQAADQGKPAVEAATDELD